VNIYGYIVVDLRRKHSEDESQPLSVQISGKIKSNKAMDFYCFLEKESSFAIDMVTGTRLS
jgi:hypothetical protein